LKRLAATFASLSLMASASAQADQTKAAPGSPTLEQVQKIITHLAFYSGWANAMSAVAVAIEVFAARKIGPDQLPDASPSPLPIDQAWETQRERRVGEQFGAVFPAMVQNTTDVLFRDLWLRPDLAPRDRSLVTVSALTANGQVA